MHYVLQHYLFEHDIRRFSGPYIDTEFDAEIQIHKGDTIDIAGMTAFTVDSVCYHISANGALDEVHLIRKSETGDYL